MGHAYGPVVKAAADQLSFGTHLGFADEWEVKHAKQIVKMVPSADKVEAISMILSHAATPRLNLKNKIMEEN